MKSRLPAAVYGLLLLVCLPGAAQQRHATTATPALSAQPAAKVEPVPVLVDGKKVIEIGWGFGSITP
ncbi:MAG TPA: hypothetical protein VIX42_10985 [Edaphobacter sp.]